MSTSKPKELVGFVLHVVRIYVSADANRLRATTDTIPSVKLAHSSTYKSFDQPNDSGNQNGDNYQKAKQEQSGKVKESRERGFAEKF